MPTSAHALLSARCPALFDESADPSDRPLLFEVEKDVGGDAGVPEWLNIFPPLDVDGLCKARDGRVVSFPQGFGPVLEKTQEALAKYGPGAVDLDHELYGWPGGGEASGWMTAIEERAGEGIFARFEPLPRGEEAVKSKTYRYTSAVIDVDRVVQYDADGWPRGYLLVAKEFFGFGLTNIPAMRVRSMFSQGAGNDDDIMKTAMLTALLTMLGLDENATPEQIKAAGQAKLSAGGTAPDPVAFVPREELNAARAELKRAAPVLAAAIKAFDIETEGKDLDAVALEVETALVGHRSAKLNAAIDDAVKAGKLPPASADSYRKTFASLPNGLAAFESCVENMPTVVSTSPKAEGGPPSSEPAALDTAPAGIDPQIWKLSATIKDPARLADEIRKLAK